MATQHMELQELLNKVYQLKKTDRTERLEEIKKLPGVVAYFHGNTEIVITNWDHAGVKHKHPSYWKVTRMESCEMHGYIKAFEQFKKRTKLFYVLIFRQNTTSAILFKDPEALDKAIIEKWPSAPIQILMEE